MNELEKALTDLDKLAGGLGVNTSDVHGTFSAVLANLLVRVKNLETAALPIVEQAAAQIAVDALEGK